MLGKAASTSSKLESLHLYGLAVISGAEPCPPVGE